MPEIARQHLNAPPPPLTAVRADLPAGLEKVVMRCLEKQPDDRFSSMDEVLGALAGLGLHGLQSVPEASAGHRRLLRRGSNSEKRPRYSPGGATYDSGSRRAAEGEGLLPDRTQARILARKKRARQRRLAGTAATVLAVIVIVVLLVTLTGGGAPAVVGLTLDQAKDLATDAGMEVQVIDQVPTFDEETGTVLEQDPIPDENSKDGVLRLTVAAYPEAIAVVEIEDYDPEGDNEENPQLLPRLTDGAETSGWITELYRSASFGNIDKTGVGLKFTLAEEATMIEIISPVKGWKGELLESVASGSAARLAVIDGNSSQIVTLRKGITSGILWFTKLAALSDDRWGVDIAELRFYK